GDVVTLENDPQSGEPLLVPVMRGGRRVAPASSLAEVRRHAAENLARLPQALRRLEAFDYRVEIAPALHDLAAEVDRSILSCQNV
ncbi:MAG TPA: nicotinate phosphoribosyltransferase, partial [Thiobacillus sp.]|nr:nicotinate phosphoribosyltransferase [Thiobacillus sp.]